MVGGAANNPDLASLSVSGTTALNGGCVYYHDGAQTYTGAATLGGDTVLTGSQATFLSTLDGGFNLTVDTAGITTFGGAVGGKAALASVTTEGGGAVEVNGGGVTTTGAQSFGGR